MSDYVFPPAPQTVHCPKCLRDVVIACTSSRTMESDCPLPDCPIANDPDNQVGDLSGRSGSSISFAAPSEISQEGRITRFAAWEKLGLDQVKHDLLNGGHRIVGGPPAVRNLAWEWVRWKEKENAVVQPPAAKPTEVLTLKPGIWGVSIDLKETWRRLRRWSQGRN